ncbi:MAG TPA: hydrogen gas-evolving membrane-bound hydrogenase subunit E [Actinomycetota bacterium]|nr:hydrogen gas-evolving membrane-bound hydrogenase subunit E [Actinomycetota bacterium]
MTGAALPAVLGGLVGLALLALPLTRWLGRNAGFVLAGGYAAAAAAIGTLGARVLEGGFVGWSTAWLPDLGPRLTLRLDGLSLVFAMLILVVGSLVMAYTARYARRGTAPAGLYSLLTLFAASMLGLVLAGDALLMFVCWEATSITSFFLIGGKGEGKAAKGAVRAFIVTAMGGLALMAGLILLSVTVRSWDLAEMMSDPEAVKAAGTFTPALLLVLLAAFTKSAQVPFHFWLPGAMVAPTPVSTYLHAATMVKAGIYVLARFTPLFAGEPAWFYTVTLVGLVTAVTGAAFALSQYDLKSLLAYSTVSQLGLLVALVGVGTYRSIAAMSLHLVAHAAYKASLFMVVGIIDTEAGSRDIRTLSGLGRAMPLVAFTTALAAVSMAGFPPLLGFVSKEEAFDSFLQAPGWMGPLAAALAVSASIMTFGYGARIFEGAFGGPLTQPLFAPQRSFVAPAVVCSLAGLAFGLGVVAFDPLGNAVVRGAFGEGDVHFALWHGFTPALALTAVTIASGTVLYLIRGRVDRVVHRVHPPLRGTTAFDALYDATIAVGRVVGQPFVSRVPARHLVWVMATTAAAGLGAWAVFGEVSPVPAPAPRVQDWYIAGLLLMAALGAALSPVRLGAVAVLGIGGFVVALLYVVLGAPDLALTQLLIETLTVVLVVLVFRRLGPRFQPVPAWRRVGAGVVAIAAGTLAAVATYTLTGHRGLSDVGAYYLEAAPEEAGGYNVVNTILVDFRALDTLGEVAVLAIAAVGVFSLVRVARRSPEAVQTAEGAEEER